MNNKKMRLTDAMKHYEKKFKKGELNVLNAPPSCGKTTFIFNEFLNNTSKYIFGAMGKYNYKDKLSKILYVCDTRMLKDSVLSENDGIVDVFGKGSIIEAKESEHALGDGTIKIMTYSTLGWFMKNAKDFILDNFDIIIADEVHNLFKYCMRYNVEIDEDGDKAFNDGEYITIISKMDEICKKTIFVAMTGTPSYIYRFRGRFKEYLNFKVRPIFTQRERENLFTYNYNPIYVNCIFSRIKSRDWKSVIEKTGYKIFIYTRTIKQSEKYKKWFDMNGLKAEWLCSVNNKSENRYIDEETGKEVVEKIPTMTGYKMEIRDRLLNGINENGDLKGTVPDDLDVLIVNGGYETGWNLLDERFQICFCDTTDLDEQEQARYRIRNDIKFLECLYKLYDEEGIALEYGQYGELIPWEIQIGVSKFRQLQVLDSNMRELDGKYVGVKLTPELKKDIKFLYGVKKLFDREVNWKTVKRDLLNKEYTIETFKGKNNGTYIFEKGKEIKKDSKRMVKKMDKLIKFLNENEGKKLTEKQKEKLIELVDARNAKGELLKTIGKINKQIDIYEIGFTVLSKSDRNGRWWQIESVVAE